jgi:hypothetical protein
LVKRYNDTITHLLAQIDEENLDYACQIASLPDKIRGYGHDKSGYIQSNGTIYLMTTLT